MVRATLPDGWSGHSQLERDGFVLLLGRRGGPLGTSVTQVYVDEVDTRCRAATAAGGQVLDEPEERPRGVRQAVVADPDGQRWVLTRRVRDTDPGDWYAEVLGPVPG